MFKTKSDSTGHILLPSMRTNHMNRVLHFEISKLETFFQSYIDRVTSLHYIEYSVIVLHFLIFPPFIWDMPRNRKVEHAKAQ